MLKNIKRFFKKIIELSQKPVMKILPGQLAFFFILSIPPLIFLIGIIGSIFSFSIESIVTFIEESFPAATSSLIIPIISGKGLDISVVAFMIGALLMVSKGTKALIVTSDTLYEVKQIGFIKTAIKSLFLVILLIFLLAFIIIVPAFGDSIVKALANVTFSGDIYTDILFVYGIFKLPLSFIFIYMVIKVIYTISPDEKINSREVTIGAVFTTIGWMLSSRVYSYYVANFTNYDIFYGSIANLIILLLWMYLLSYIFVLGMALNASTHSITEDIAEEAAIKDIHKVDK